MASSFETNHGLFTDGIPVSQSSSSIFGNSQCGQNFSFASTFGNTASEPLDTFSNFSFKEAFNNQSESIFGGISTQLSGVFGQNQIPEQTPIFRLNQGPRQTWVELTVDHAKKQILIVDHTRNGFSGSESLTDEGEKFESFCSMALMLALWKVSDQPLLTIDDFDFYFKHSNMFLSKGFVELKLLNLYILEIACTKPKSQILMFIPQGCPEVQPSAGVSLLRLIGRGRVSYRNTWQRSCNEGWNEVVCAQYTTPNKRTTSIGPGAVDKVATARETAIPDQVAILAKDLIAAKADNEVPSICSHTEEPVAEFSYSHTDCEEIFGFEQERNDWNEQNNKEAKMKVNSNEDDPESKGQQRNINKKEVGCNLGKKLSFSELLHRLKMRNGAKKRTKSGAAKNRQLREKIRQMKQNNIENINVSPAKLSSPADVPVLPPPCLPMIAELQNSDSKLDIKKMPLLNAGSSISPNSTNMLEWPSLASGSSSSSDANARNDSKSSKEDKVPNEIIISLKYEEELS